MSEIRCKNCGGSIWIDIEKNLIVCDSCGAQQDLRTAFSDNTNEHIYDESGVSEAELDKYKRAMAIMNTARTEESLLAAAKIFDELSDFFGGHIMAAECRKNAELFKKERLYKNATVNMNSNDPSVVERALKIFEELGDYKDSTQKACECIPLLASAREKYSEWQKKAEHQRIKDENNKKIKAAKNKFFSRLAVFLVITIVVICVIGHFSKYSSSNIKIKITPDAKNYITQEYNGYIFRYNVKILNKGTVDVRSVEGTVSFVDGSEVVVDTSFNFSNYSSAAVRAKKSSSYNWELTVYSESTAVKLSEKEFKDLDIEIDITRISYTNGKTKNFYNNY